MVFKNSRILQQNSMSNFDQPTRRVLSIDGGGIRGIMPAMVIAHLEKQFGKPACELFDLIVGTSTVAFCAGPLFK